MSIISSVHGGLRHEIHAAAKDSPPQQTRYTYLFPRLAAAEARRFADAQAAERHFGDLNWLSILMDSHAGGVKKSSLPAIYTYFGQFLNHDISAPFGTPASVNAAASNTDANVFAPEVIENTPDLVGLVSSKRPESPRWVLENILNEHPAPMTLDSVYGAGPFDGSADIRDLYDPTAPLFLVGQTIREASLAHLTPNEAAVNHKPGPDLRRNPAIREALIADRRNDENLVVAQLHLAILLFHNRVVAHLQQVISNPRKLFSAARRLVTWHYQWCIVNDYLAHIAPGAADRVQGLVKRRRLVPLEFTSAAFRFGHSMVGAGYDYNQNFRKDGIFGPASLGSLFDFTSRNDMGGSANPLKQLPDHWVIEWERFLRADPADINSRADRIDPLIAGHMTNLPTPAQNIPHRLSSISNRNLKRGFHRFIASGQKLAAVLSVEVTAPDAICDAFGGGEAADGLRRKGFDRETPAWAYFLCEAAVKTQGNLPGPTAAAIVAETIVGLLKRDPGSVLNARASDGLRGWTPADSPLRTPDGVPVDSIRAFLRYAGVMP